MRIDLHAHLWNAAYLDLIDELGAADTAAQQGLRAGDSADELARRFDILDAAGIDVQVLSAAPLLPCVADERLAVDAARRANDWYAEVAEHSGGRLHGLTTTPMPHVEASLVEIARALDELHLVGVAMTTSILGRPLTDPEFEPFFKELDRRGSVLALHPTGNCARSALIATDMAWMVGAPIEDAICAAQLIVAGIPSRYPNVRIINAHLGGAVPMLLERWDNKLASAAPDSPEPPSAAARKMWYDSVTHAHVPALRCAVDTLGAERIVLGTDYPYDSPDGVRRAVDYVAEIGLGDSEIAAIRGGTAAALLGSSVTGGRSGRGS